MKEIPTRDQLALTLQSSAAPGNKAWEIYRFLKANIGADFPSNEARALLSQYINLQTEKPSLLHSLMLGIALKMAEAYPEFKLGSFIKIWGVSNLRPDDFTPHKDEKSGRTFHSLVERLSASLLRYKITHPDEDIPSEAMDIAMAQGEKLGFLPYRRMIAIKMFESVHDGRKLRMVKLIDPQGEELASDSRVFHTKPWEIVGRMYEVLSRRAEKSGKVRIDSIAPCNASISDVFGKAIGFVDSYDDKHKHYHIYDNTSRHFVAEAPSVRISVGDYVWFAPVIPSTDNFKSAIVLSVEDKDTGRQAFGAIKAHVTYINIEKGYFAYSTEHGEQGYGNLKTVQRPIAVGQPLCLTIYSRRGRNGEKRPFVGDAY